jgi:hypothetical protein
MTLESNLNELLEIQEEERKARQITYDDLETKVIAALLKDGQKPHVIYSAYQNDPDSPNYDILDDNLDDIAVSGKVMLWHPGDWNWGGDETMDYRSPILENPTWLQVTLYANRMIEAINDYHHIFLESLEEQPHLHTADYKVYRFWMGS